MTLKNNRIQSTPDDFLLSNNHLRLLDRIFISHHQQCNLNILKQQIIDWMAMVLSEERENWSELKENLDAAIDASLEEKLEEFAEDKNETDSDMQDAIYALRGLGFTQSEALQAVKKARPNAKDLQELIALALRSLN